jgi:hypothetical protein
MESAARSLEKAGGTRDAPTHARAAPRSSSGPPQVAFGTAAVQRAAGNLAIQRSLDTGLIQRKCTCGGQTGPDDECAECREKRFLQREAASNTPPAGLPAIVHEAMRTPGKPLDHGSRDFMESRFNDDFGDVRVHTDPAAQASAKALGATAYTSGRDIYFAAGKYAPQSSEGERLLAHELAHTIQQRSIASLARQVASTDNLDVDPDDSLEREAERAAEQVVSSARIVPRGGVLANDSGSIQRQAEHDLTRRSIQPEFTQFLSDEELQSESLHLRQRLSELAFGDPEHAVIQQNLYLVITEARRRFVELPAPEPGQDHEYEFRGRMLTTDPVSIRYVLEQLIVEAGEGGAETFIGDLESDLDERSRDSDQAWQIFQGLKRALLPVLQAQFDILKRENAEFLAQFAETAKETLRELLQKSEERLNAERVRYGIPTNEFLGDRPLGTTLAQAGLEQTPELGELQEAVNLFVRLRAQRDDRVENLKKEITSLKRLKAQNDPGKEDDPEMILMADQIEKDQREIDLEARLFQVRKAELIRLYPILASWIGDDDSSEFHRLGFFPKFDAMGVMISIQAVIVDKLGNIAKVRDELDHDKLNVWKLPRLVAATRARLQIPDDLTIRWRVVEDKVAHADDKGFWESVGLGLVQLGLVLLAPLTEGATLIPAAAISGYNLYQHGEEFAQQSALAGTDFDKALAISADKPSSFWLALDAVLFLADTSAALKAFEKLSTLIPQIREARTLEEAERMVRTAVPEGSEEFARRIVAEARVGEEVSTAERILSEEGQELQNLRRLAESEAKDAEGLLASAATATGDTAKVTEGGHLVICSEPCQWMRERFARQLGRDSTGTFENRLAGLERRAAAAAKADKATAKALADKIAEDAAILQRDLAYSEYRLAGGTGTLEEFAASERVRLTEFRDQAVAAQRRVEQAEESLRRARQDVQRVHGELSYYRTETEKTARELAAKEAEAEALDAEVMALREDPTRAGNIEEAERKAAQARAEAAKLRDELEDSRKVVSRSAKEAGEAAESVKTAERQSEAMSVSQKRQIDLSRDIDALQNQYDNLPEVQDRPYLYRHSPPPSAEGVALLRRIEALKQELRNEIEAAAQSAYNRLRGISPGPLARDRALRNLRLRPQLRKGAEAIDVTNPSVVLNSSEISPDHIYSLKRITEEEGFNRLTPRQQDFIAEMVENYTPLTVAANSSKGDLLMKDWFLTPIGRQVPPDIREVLLDLERDAITKVQDQIKAFLK